MNVSNCLENQATKEAPWIQPSTPHSPHHRPCYLNPRDLPYHGNSVVFRYSNFHFDLISSSHAPTPLLKWTAPLFPQPLSKWTLQHRSPMAFSNAYPSNPKPLNLAILPKWPSEAWNPSIPSRDGKWRNLIQPMFFLRPHPDRLLQKYPVNPDPEENEKPPRLRLVPTFDEILEDC